MSGFDKEMQDALRADAEKLRAMGADVADPVFLEPTNCEPKASGWRDIESDPPRDGQECLFLQGSFCFQGHWIAGAKHAVACGAPYGESVTRATHWQPLLPPPGEDETRADRAALTSVIAAAEEREDALRAENAELKARYDKLEVVVRQMVDAIGKGAVDSEEIVPVPGDGPPYRFHEEWAHHARSALSPKEESDGE